MTSQDAGSSDRPERPASDARQKAKAARGEFEAFTPGDLQLLYLRQIRTVLVTMSVLAIVGFIGALIIGILVIIDFSHVTNLLNYSYGGTPIACQSQGGTKPNC
jgi:hypothetical protein